MRRTTRVVRVATAVALVLLACAGVSSAEAPANRVAAADNSRGAAGYSVPAAADRRATGAARAGVDYGIPPVSYDPTIEIPYGGAFDIRTTARKAKVSFTLKDQHTLTYAKVCVALVLGSGLPNIETCCPDESLPTCFKVNPPPTSADDSGQVNWTRISGPTWVESPRNVSPTHGVFSPVRVSALAFGSIPVTAEVTLSQPTRRDGYAEPLSFDYGVEVQPLPEGTTVPGYEPAPPSSGNGSFFYLPAAVVGRVQVRVSDLRVDGEPVDVGRSCRTRTPATIKVGAPGGWSDQLAKLGDRVGRPGEFQTVPGSQMQGTVDVPAFSGCGRGGENLDPLLTSFVSGPNNPVSIRLLTTLNGCDQQCAPYPIEPTPPAAGGDQRQVSSPTAAAQVPTNRVLASLSATQRAKVVKNLAHASARVRAAALSALPELRQAVRAAR